MMKPPHGILLLAALITAVTQLRAEEPKPFTYNAELSKLSLVTGLVEVTLPIENPHEVPVSVTNVRVTCSCTKAPDIVGQTLQPNERTTITFSVAISALREQAIMNATVYGAFPDTEGPAPLQAQFELAKYQLTVDTTPLYHFPATLETLEITGDESPEFIFQNASSVRLENLEFRSSLPNISIVSREQSSSDLPDGVAQQHHCKLRGFQKHLTEPTKPMVVEVFAMCPIATPDPEVKILAAIAKTTWKLRYPSKYTIKPNFILASAKSASLVVVCAQGNAEAVALDLMITDEEGVPVPSDHLTIEAINSKWVRVHVKNPLLADKSIQRLIFRFETDQWEDAVDVR
jgi:hypothetical protein